MKQRQLHRKGQKTLGIPFFAVILVGILAIYQQGYTATDNTTCSAEPTDMTISYGTAITCAIDVEGDSDLFRFTGSAEDVIVIQVAWNSGSMRPCIELIAPDNSHIEACANAFTNRIDTTLTQTGTYTALVDVFSGGTGAYALALERLIEPSPNAQAIEYGELAEGQIDPEGELDLFFFAGIAGETVLLQVAWQSGSARPCVQLIAPNNERTQACSNAFTNRIDMTLDQTGTYTVLIEVFFGGTANYTFTLERLLPLSATAQALQFGIVTTGEINPVGELDLFAFNGSTGDRIVLTITWQNGSFRPCIQLIYPDNTREIACNNAFSNQLDTTLNQTGTYVVLADVFFGGTGNYTLELQCITGKCLITPEFFIDLPAILKQ